MEVADAEVRQGEAGLEGIDSAQRAAEVERGFMPLAVSLDVRD